MAEFEIKWWKDWLEADMLKRLEMVEKLPFTKNIFVYADIKDKELRKRGIASHLNGFFEDLEQAIYVKMENELSICPHCGKNKDDKIEKIENWRDKDETN